MSEATPTTPLPQPRKGGCYVRLPDGSLVPENEAPAAELPALPAGDQPASPATPE